MSAPEFAQPVEIKHDIAPIYDLKDTIATASHFSSFWLSRVTENWGDEIGQRGEIGELQARR